MGQQFVNQEYTTTGLKYMAGGTAVCQSRVCHNGSKVYGRWDNSLKREAAEQVHNSVTFLLWLCYLCVECEMASTTDDGGALPVIIDMSTLEDKPAAVRCMLTAGWGQRMGQRSFRPAWFFQFPWLEYDVASNRFRCKCCAVYNSVSNFAIGKLVSVPKRHTFVSHEVSDGHKMALKAYNADARNKPLGSGVDDLGKV